jgi:hypothetical protein
MERGYGLFKKNLGRFLICNFGHRGQGLTPCPLPTLCRRFFALLKEYRMSLYYTSVGLRRIPYIGQYFGQLIWFGFLVSVPYLKSFLVLDK